MKRNQEVINDLLVETFNKILYIEEKSICNSCFNDLTITEIHAIDAIERSKEKTMSDIAKILEVTLGTWTIASNKLEKKGFIEKERPYVDKRVTYVKLTEKGKKAREIHEEFHREMVEVTVSELNKEQQQIFIDALEKINDFFKAKEWKG